MRPLTNEIGLPWQPFSATRHLDSNFISRSQQAVRQRVRRNLLQDDGHILVTGQPGVGKSVLMKVLERDLTSLPPAGGFFRVPALAWRTDPDVSARLEQLVRGETALDASGALPRPVALLDDAGDLDGAAIQELLIFADTGPERMRLIIAGSSAVLNVITGPGSRLAALVQHRYALEPLEEDEIAAYVWHRFRVAGADRDDLVSEDAIAQVAERSGGVPALINMILGQALVVAQQEGSNHVLLHHVDEAVRESEYLLPDVAPPVRAARPQPAPPQPIAAKAGPLDRSGESTPDEPPIRVGPYVQIARPNVQEALNSNPPDVIARRRSNGPPARRMMMGAAAVLLSVAGVTTLWSLAQSAPKELTRPAESPAPQMAAGIATPAAPALAAGAEILAATPTTTDLPAPTMEVEAIASTSPLADAAQSAEPGREAPAAAEPPREVQAVALPDQPSLPVPEVRDEPLASIPPAGDAVAGATALEAAHDPLPAPAATPGPAESPGAAPTSPATAAVEETAPAAVSPPVTVAMPAPLEEALAAPVAAPPPPDPPVSAPAPRVEAPRVAPAEATKPVPTRPAAAAVARDVASARQQIAIGNIAAARAMLEQIDDSDGGTALLLLGETYDPARLRAWGAIGTKPDPAKALGFYRRAAERGNKVAADRLPAGRQSNTR